MLTQLKQEDLNVDKPAGGGGGSGGSGISGKQYEDAARKAQDEIRDIALQNLKETTKATIESMKVSHASQMTSLFIGMMTEAESMLIKAGQAYLQLAGQAHALMTAGIQ